MSVDKKNVYELIVCSSTKTKTKHKNEPDIFDVCNFMLFVVFVVFLSGQALGLSDGVGQTRVLFFQPVSDQLGDGLLGSPLQLLQFGGYITLQVPIGLPKKAQSHFIHIEQ